ncbi:thiamine kinase-like enzyme [Bacillus ectoiniformans]|uniref:phosphotransferase n=1 Tax=Bacillus ectoiniformans TaxID=1494429 RepID=UPI001EF7CFCC|nr:phosphotransferase [Bacillus ectoiniformans]MBM7647435.1 thiamine kinase-like enzyme [Bacillus ectoiniformans]
MYSQRELVSKLQEQQIEQKLSAALHKKAVIDYQSIRELKSTQRSSIYQILLQLDSDELPVIFKIYHSKKYKNEIEVNIYSEASLFLQEFLPEIYLIEKHGKETWVFMEFVRQIRGQLTFTPKHFDSIIPTIAKLHAHTFEENFHQHQKTFSPWLPLYQSQDMKASREKFIANTIQFLDQSQGKESLSKVIQPHFQSLKHIYENEGPDFFPELLECGSCITHGDLHLQNICSHNTAKAGPWDIQLIDWESAKFSPPWFDMVVLVELLIGFRLDWQRHAEEIRTRTVQLYTNEIKKYGIHFQTKPMQLYKMAYLQRTLEKGLHTQLRRIFDNRGGELLSYHLEKVSTWGSELGIYK